MGDNSYKLSFIFALTLHLVLIIFLLIKFTNYRSVALNMAGTFINAVAVNERDLNNRMNETLHESRVLPKQEKEMVKTVAAQQDTRKQHDVAIKKEKIKEQINNILQKNLLAEQAREMAALKKQRQTYKKELAKKRQQQMQQLLQNQAIAEQKQLVYEQAQAHARQRQGEIDKYKAMVIQAIASQWIVPDGVDKNATCQLLVNIAPGGMVIDVQLLKSSGNSVLDRSAQTAVLKASPLPVPEIEELFASFRTIKLTVKPEGVIGG